MSTAIPDGPTIPLTPAARPSRRRSAAPVLGALAVALLAGLGVAAVYVVAVLSTRGRAVDDAVMTAAMDLGAGRADELTALLDLVAVPTVLLATVALAGAALARGRGASAAAVVALVLGSQLVTQVLKAVLPREGDPAGNSLPSGHVTLVVALAVALVVALPRALRPLAALLGVGAAAVTAVATMVAGWHRPSDLVAAVGVVIATAAVVALVGAGRDRTGAAVTPGRRRSA